MSLALLLAVTGRLQAQNDPQPQSLEQCILESPLLRVEVETGTGRWSLLDKRSGVRWPTSGTASAGDFTPQLTSGFAGRVSPADGIVLSHDDRGMRVAFQLVDEGRTLKIVYEGFEQVDALDDALVVTADEQGHVIVPCREGLLIPASSGVAFRQDFGTSDYEGCHMNMLGLLKTRIGLGRRLGRRLCDAPRGEQPDRGFRAGAAARARA